MNRGNMRWKQSGRSSSGSSSSSAVTSNYYSSGQHSAGGGDGSSNSSASSSRSSSGSSSSAGACGALPQDSDRDPDTLMRGTLEPGARFTVTAAEILQVAYPLARQQPLPGPAQPPPQPAGAADDDEGGSDADTEAAGAQQATGKRKRKHGGGPSRAANNDRSQARRRAQLAAIEPRTEVELIMWTSRNSRRRNDQDQDRETTCSGLKYLTRICITIPQCVRGRRGVWWRISRPSSRAADYLRERIRGGRARKCGVVLNPTRERFPSTFGAHMPCTSEDLPLSWVEGRRTDDAFSPAISTP
jgi:hypothetical protein